MSLRRHANHALLLLLLLLLPPLLLPLLLLLLLLPPRQELFGTVGPIKDSGVHYDRK
jgi:hypothetical protein